MLCPKCQHRNPDENRFCGNCGCDLTKSASTIYPREGYDEADLPPVSKVESTVPRFRRDVPPLPPSEYGPVSEDPGNARIETSSFEEIPLSEIPVREIDRTRNVPSTPVRNVPIETREPIPSRLADRTEPIKEMPPREIVREGTPEPPREDMRSYGTTGGILFNLDPRKSTPLVESREPAAHVSEPVTPRRSEGIHGPSFLGLADSSEPDFLDEIDEPESHSRRNWLLLALLILIGLAALQWRNIRETGINFAGSMKLNLPGKIAPARPAETAATDSHSENGPANNGKPEIVVDPTNKSSDQSAQNTTPPAAANGNAAQPASTPPSQSAAPDGAEQQGATAKNDSAAAKPTQQQPAQQAKNAPPAKPADSAGDEDNTADTEDATPAAKAPTKSAKGKTPAPKPEPVSAGAEELAHANTAGSPETAAKWLWASTSKGNLDAPVRLADMYATGRGVPKDCEQANVLLRSSARRGNPRASARLGMYYATGQCVQQDRAQAWHWLSVAHQRDPNSDWITQYRQRLWSEMTPEERARAGNGPTANASE